jgi:hypothetical protein
MKTIANRLIVFAAGVFALGSVAYGQTRMTAEIPFAFHTATASLPAGTYQFAPQANSGGHMVVIRNVETRNASLAGWAVHNVYDTAKNKPVVEFLCGANGCSLKAIRTAAGSLEYPAQHKSKKAEVAVISVPLKSLATD